MVLFWSFFTSTTMSLYCHIDEWGIHFAGMRFYSRGTWHVVWHVVWHIVLNCVFYLETYFFRLFSPAKKLRLRMSRLLNPLKSTLVTSRLNLGSKFNGIWICRYVPGTLSPQENLAVENVLLSKNLFFYFFFFIVILLVSVLPTFIHGSMVINGYPMVIKASS